MNACQPAPSAAAIEALSKSFLGGQPAEVCDAILRDSRVATYPAGALIYGRDTNDGGLCLIHRGQVRAKVTSADGRAVTTRYMTAGQVTALPATLTRGAPASLEAVTFCEVSLLDPRLFRQLMKTRAEFCYAVAVHLAESTYDSLQHLEDNLFGSVQQRVSKHLLEMSRPTVEGLIVQIDQTELADAIGSVREVVARALKKLSESGAIRRSHRRIWIEDPVLLRSLASTREGASPTSHLSSAGRRPA